METSEDRLDAGLRDADLIEAVRRAVEHGASPLEVEELVGRRAWINTTRRPDDVAARMADIGAGEEAIGDGPGGASPQLADARHIVYWGRPVPARNPRIVGIAWDAGDLPGTFFGILYPP